MTVYVVVRTGVYDRGICGVFSTRALAEAAALVYKAREPDDYHKFDVREFGLDDITSWSGNA